MKRAWGGDWNVVVRGILVILEIVEAPFRENDRVGGKRKPRSIENTNGTVKAPEAKKREIEMRSGLMQMKPVAETRARDGGNERETHV